MNSNDKVWAVFWTMLGLTIITAIIVGATRRPEPVDPAKGRFIQTCAEKGKAAQIVHSGIEEWSCK